MKSSEKHVLIVRGHVTLLFRREQIVLIQTRLTHGTHDLLEVEGDRHPGPIAMPVPAPHAHVCGFLPWLGRHPRHLDGGVGEVVTVPTASFVQ